MPREPFPFPHYVKTKADAKALVDELLPPYPRLAARLLERTPDLKHPYYQVGWEFQERFHELCVWLRDKHTHIYKRAAWALFYDLGKRINDLLSEAQRAAPAAIEKEYEQRKKQDRLGTCDSARGIIRIQVQVQAQAPHHQAELCYDHPRSETAPDRAPARAAHPLP